MCTSLGAKTHDGIDEVVVGELHVRQVDVSVILALVGDHHQHLGHGWLTISTLPLLFGW